MIDFAPFLTDDALGQQQVAEHIFRACHQVDFLYLKHHGVFEQAIDALVKHHQTQGHTLRLLHCPPLSIVPKPRQIRAGLHSAYGPLTLLFQDDVGEIEVLLRCRALRVTG